MFLIFVLAFIDTLFDDAYCFEVSRAVVLAYQDEIIQPVSKFDILFQHLYSPGRIDYSLRDQQFLGRLIKLFDMIVDILGQKDDPTQISDPVGIDLRSPTPWCSQNIGLFAFDRQHVYVAIEAFHIVESHPQFDMSAFPHARRTGEQPGFIFVEDRR